MRIIYRQSEIFKPDPDEISIESWEPSMEHECFFYAETGDDTEIVKQHLRSFMLRRLNNNNDRKPPRPEIRRRVDIKARNRKPRVNGASKPNFIGGSTMNKITCRRLRI